MNPFSLFFARLTELLGPVKAAALVNEFAGQTLQIPAATNSSNHGENAQAFGRGVVFEVINLRELTCPNSPQYQHWALYQSNMQQPHGLYTLAPNSTSRESTLYAYPLCQPELVHGGGVYGLYIPGSATIIRTTPEGYAALRDYLKPEEVAA